MKVFLQTFGCRANQYDSETVRSMIQRSGGEVVESVEGADVAIFNSCAVTASAEVQLRKSIRRSARDRPELTTVVMGCAAALDRGVLRGLPTVQHVVAGADFTAIAQALALPPAALGAATSQRGTRALLRIQDGCDEHCTFCSTTLARGENRSRGVEELVREAQVLAERHPEIVLTGIHIGTFGADTGSSLGALVSRLVRDVPTVRFRLSSVEVTEVDAALRELWQSPLHLAPHLHAPLQSGSNRVLKRMGRHWYSVESYREAVQSIAKSLPVFGLGADVIAGFPGESESEHLETMDLIDGLPFTYLHVFPYSARPGTAADRLPGRLAPDVVERRARELRDLAERKASAYRHSRIGAVSDVVVVRNEVREGVTEDYLTVGLTAPAPPRGTRLFLRLEGGAQRLTAVPLVPVTVA